MGGVDQRGSVMDLSCDGDRAESGKQWHRTESGDQVCLLI